MIAQIEESELKDYMQAEQYQQYRRKRWLHKDTPTKEKYKVLWYHDTERNFNDIFGKINGDDDNES